MLLRITDDGIAAEYHQQQTGPARGEVGSSGCYGSCGEQFGESANELGDEYNTYEQGHADFAVMLAVELNLP